MKNCSIVKYETSDYESFVKLRYEILRKPLGLSFSDKDLQQDANDILCAYYLDNEIIGTCILSLIDEKRIKLRQMAIADKFQNKGIGAKLILFAEQKAVESGYSRIELNARKLAINFYLKLGYKIINKEFTEIGIPHYKMEKTINQAQKQDWTTEEQDVLNKVSRYIDINVVPFANATNEVLSIEKRDPMYEGEGVVYMLSIFQKGDLVNNRIGVYMVLLNKGDQAGFHEHGSKKEQELYVILHGEGRYTERLGDTTELRTFQLKKGNITSIKGENNYHSITNATDEPLIVFVITTNEPS